MLEINTAKIKNTVTFVVDKDSLKEAKDSIKSIQTFANNIEPSLNMSKMKRQMREMERYARRMHNAMNGSGGRGGAGGGGAGAPPVPPGAGGGPRPPKPDKAAAAAARRADMGRLRIENFNQKAGNYGKADTQSLEQARNIIAQTVALYEREQISLARLNQTMAHQLDMIRRSHREKVADIEDEVRGRRRVKRELTAQAKMQQRIRDRERKDRERADKREADARRRDRSRKYDRVREGAIGLSPTMLGTALLGAGLFAGLSRVMENMSTTAERTNMVSRGAQNVQTNPNAVLTMRTWGEQNGVDSANIIKAIDNIKDVRERLGNTALNSKFKDGKWTGGDSGINDIMNQFGWTKDQVAQFQNRPLDFIQATVNEGQRRGMNSAQIGRLMENLGDDLMHYQRMFLNNGKEFMATLDMLKRTGAALSEEQIVAAQQYQQMSIKFGLVGEGFSNNFLTGFMQAMEKSPDFEKNVAIIDEAAKSLGETLGKLSTGILNTFSWFLTQAKESREQPVTPLSTPAEMQKAEAGHNSWAQQQYGIPAPGAGSSDGDWASDVQNSVRSWVQGLFETPNMVPNVSLNRSALTPTGGNSPQQATIVNKVEIPADAITVNVVPDGYGFSNFLRTEMNTGFDTYTQGLTLQVSSGQSSTGG